MRCLNKVVFINSANVPYAEIRLDGNVHFIGTQGVGKSTLLRAILFFYNGDKQKLGIPKEKKSFDDFYIPHANSYIVYEVTHERGDFCVLVFRSQGRACFRFVAGNYDRRLLVDETGDVTSDYTLIRQRLAGRYMSRIVDRYDEYRNIIYGNHRVTDKEFYNFALMESPAYQNIPRSLQNVFLNSRVDADFIKEIIIRSMNDDVPSIDLSYYRRQVADFAMEYENISEWFREDSKGVNHVRLNAQKVIDSRRRLIFLKSKVETLYAELLYADRIARESIPEMQERIKRHQSELQRYERLLAEQKHKYEKDVEEVNKSIGEVESKLKEIKLKRKEYEMIGIDSLLARVDAEPSVRMQLDSLRKRKEALTRTNLDLSAKYEVLEGNIQTEFHQFEYLANEKIVGAKERFVALSGALSEVFDDCKRVIDAERVEALDSLAEKMNSLTLRERELDKDFVQLKYWRPLGDEIDAKLAQADEIGRSEQTLKSQINTYDLEIGKLIQEFEFGSERIKSQFSEKEKELEMEISGFTDKISRIDSLLTSSAGSFYEWLDRNAPGWERTVGKVVDQQKILYCKGLNPRLAGGESSTSLFGIKLDLGDLDTDVKSPAELRKDKEMYVNAITDIKSSLAELSAACEKEVQSLSSRLSPKIKDLREKRTTDSMNLQILPGKVKTLRTEIHGLEDKQCGLIEKRKEELDKIRQDISLARYDLDQTKKRIDSDCSSKMKAARKSHSQKITALETERDTAIEAQKSEIAIKRRWMDTSLGELKARRDAELKGAGVDVKALRDCEEQLEKLAAEIAFIEASRGKSIEYRLDKQNLFDREDEFKQTRRTLEDKRGMLAEKHQSRVRQIEEKCGSERSLLESLKTDIKESEDGIARFEAFRNSESFPPFLMRVAERPTLSRALPLIGEIRDTLSERMAVNDQFKRFVNLFKAPFGPGNVFQFKTNLVLDEDYLDYASNLEEFVEQNKIEDYRGRTSDRYLEILQRVSREMGDISGFGSEVDKIIREINYDFKEKNFVGAIRSIEIRSTDSADRMVQLLLKIKEFTDENSFNLGGLNLFSDEKGRNSVNREAVGYLSDFMASLNEFQSRASLTLSDTFQLQFRVVENDNDTGWVEKIANVGSDGTDILVKAMVNIMLINVFKEKVSRKFGEFRIHCMMDEIGKLHPNNVKGILDFANSRNILLINSSPTTYNVTVYKHTYLLSKDKNAKTIVYPLISKREAAISRTNDNQGASEK